MRIRILVTGGTFDKQYDELTGRLFFRETHVPEMLGRGRCRLDVDGRHRHDGGQPRARRRRPRGSSSSGAGRRRNRRWSSRTARTRWSRRRGRIAAAGLRDRTIVLTGAMVPYAFGSSDGLFNLGSALSFAQVLPPGVYIAMNGQYFAWDRVRKNRESGIFEATT